MIRTFACVLGLGLAVTAGTRAADPSPLSGPATAFTPGKGQTVALNPQPLPPRWLPSSRFDKVTLNPQPLPPRVTGSPFGKLTVNPQPHPRVIYTPSGRRIIRR